MILADIEPAGSNRELVLMILVPLVFAVLGLWIYAVLDCWRRKDLDLGGKAAWTVVLFLASGLGLICYFAFRNPKRVDAAQAMKKV